MPVQVSARWREAGGAAFSFRRQRLAKAGAVASRLVAELGAQNVLFIHLPQKDELGSGPNVLGKQAADFIRNNGWPFVDGFEKCHLAITDFHLRDGHPNAVGYGKLEKCIGECLKDAFHLSS